MNLYEISKEYQETFLALSEIDGLDDQIIEDTMSAIKGEMEDKCRNVAAYFQNIDADVEAMEGVIKKISARMKTEKAKSNRFREYLKTNMEACGIKKIECPEFCISLKDGAKESVVEVDDVDSLPDDYKKTVSTAKKTEIKAALKKGESIEGCRLVDGKSSLVIK